MLGEEISVFWHPAVPGKPGCSQAAWLSLQMPGGNTKIKVSMGVGTR